MLYPLTLISKFHWILFLNKNLINKLNEIFNMKFECSEKKKFNKFIFPLSESECATVFRLYYLYSLVPIYYDGDAALQYLYISHNNARWEREPCVCSITFILCRYQFNILYFTIYFNTAANHTFGSIFDVSKCLHFYLLSFSSLSKNFPLCSKMCIHLSDMICFEWKMPMDGKILALYVVV